MANPQTDTAAPSTIDGHTVAAHASARRSEPKDPPGRARRAAPRDR